MKIDLSLYQRGLYTTAPAGEAMFQMMGGPLLRCGMSWLMVKQTADAK
jgi:hypothetical protein